VYSRDGEKLGSVEELFVDYETNQPEWIGLGTGLFGTKRALVPVHGAEIRDDSVAVPYAKEQVKESPDIDADEIPEETERALYSHYGVDYSERRSSTVLPEGGPATGASVGSVGGLASEPAGTVDEGDVVRHEEELRVGKRGTEAGRARLRKWVETEPVSEDVTLERETARVEREPIDQPASGAGIGEEEIEVPLRAEEPVVQKETIAKERVGLEKDVETERETVGDELKKERVDVEGDIENR
jgi:uncharacterized protein (TIGR02271 family)